MKIVYTAVAVVCSALSWPTLAQTHKVYDTDGFDRHTDYAQGPLIAAATHNTSARDALIYLYHKDTVSHCDSGAFYRSEDSDFIASAWITSIAPVADIVQARIPESALNVNKYLEVSCQDVRGVRYLIQHKIPSLPHINWQAEVTPAGNFIEVSRGYSYHDAIGYSGSLNIDNHTRQGSCRVTQDRGTALGLFNGKSSKHLFHADVFVTHIQVSNDQPVLLQSIQCSNPSGTTRRLKVWDLTKEEQIELIEDQQFYQ